ncbi:MAG: isoleucine--tRNA ligase [Holosporaceae bacterium]|jgi:isoleucyl-tRNA synthetase|nr:isoleucine--tRNA ligase [Holosporaceae bacterium]
MNFKDTIFLPITDFQMRGNLAQKEPEILEYWNKIGLYGRIRAVSAGCAKFLLHDGPPFANGTPHAGTAMNKVLKDIVVRMKQMQGFDTPFVPGWDCHGLPIEWKIEEQLRESGKSKDHIPVPEFRDMCRRFAEHWIDVQRNGFKRLGVSGDWENPYLTMDGAAEAAVIRQIGQFILDGSLYCGEKPVLWSVVEQTALADAEIEYLDKKSTSVYLTFPVKSSDVEFLQEAHCVIWTTTPWTIPGNRAICYSKELNYHLLKAGDRQIVIAGDLLNDFCATTGIGVEFIREFPGDLMANTICHHPLHRSGYGFDVPLIHGDHVDAKTGTGLVHTAPGHGVEDFHVCKKFSIGAPLTVDGGGLYHENVPLFAGKHIFQAEDEILSALTAVDALLFRAKIIHSYPHSWRSKAPLIFRTTRQWFISMENTGLRDKALAEIDKTKWIPPQGYNRIRAFVENRDDWCVSRQRVWGVPLPLFVNRRTGEPLMDAAVIDRIANLFSKNGSNAWFLEDPQVFLGDKYRSTDYEQVTDTLDVWFESASTHVYVVKDEDTSAKADLYLEGSDQHRGWFQHSLLNSCGTCGKAPFKAVMTHGFIVDEQGRKMSKSLGNTITLDEVINSLGADVFRMWVCCSDFTQDLKLGTNILKQLEDVYRKLRNTIRYMLGALNGHVRSTEFVEYEQLPELEKWVLQRLTEVNAELMACVESYDINRYFTVLHTFCSGDLSSFFFDIRKDCLYCDHPHSLARRAYRCTLDVLFQYVIRLLAPITVFTAEEAWLSIHGTSSVHLEQFLTPCDEWKNPEVAQRINLAKEIRKIITAALEIARKNKIIGSSLQAHVTVFDPESFLPTTDVEFWKEIAIVSSFSIRNEPPPPDAFRNEESNGVGVAISVANGEKCERCWKIVPSMGEEKICKRCRDALAPEG